jgi:hypothetical protein
LAYSQLLYLVYIISNNNKNVNTYFSTSTTEPGVSPLPNTFGGQSVGPTLSKKSKVLGGSAMKVLGGRKGV